MAQEYLVVRGAREHNLKNVSVSIPRNRLTVITGLSGSGKSSLAFDTIYAEGQRRYVESLSAYARQFLGLMEKPDVDAIEGLSPAISIEQKTTGQNPRSTVGTVTEIYDYLRLLWARVGIPHCPNDGTPVTRQSAAQITDSVLAWPAETRIEVLAPIVRGRKGEFRDLLDDVRKRGFVRVRVDGETYDLADVPALNRRQNHDIAVMVDRLVVRADDRSRLNDSIETALKTADGIVEVVRYGRGPSEREPVTFSERFACPVCGLSLPELEPRQFSFNSPFGACPDCHGVGTRREVNADLVLGDASISILEGVILPWGEPTGYLRKVVLPTLAKAFKFDLNAPWGEHSAAAQHALLHGAPGRFKFQTDGARGRGEYESDWEGVLRNVERRYRESSSDAVRTSLEEFMIEQPCQTCGGKRLRAESLAVLVHGHGIGDVVDLPVGRAIEFFEGIPLRSNGRAAGARRRHRRADPQGSDATGSAFSGTWVSTTSRSAAAPRRSRAARPSASGWPPRSAPAWSACSTSWTSRASGCTSATTSACWGRCAACATWATRSSWSSTTPTPSRRPTTSSTWVRARAGSAAR